MAVVDDESLSWVKVRNGIVDWLFYPIVSRNPLATCGDTLPIEECCCCCCQERTFLEEVAGDVEVVRLFVLH